MKSNRLIKRGISLLVALMMIVPIGVLEAFAASPSLAANQAVETVELGSDVWDTPITPRKPDFVAGTAQPVISLNETTGNGTWKFLFESPAGIPLPDAENQDFDFTAWKNKNWENVIVPGGLVMQGFDIGNNTEYYYQRTVQIPADYASNRIIIRFYGAYTNTRIWVNDQYVRTHIGGFTVWDNDITDLVKPGETVTLTVGIADTFRTEEGIWNPSGGTTRDPSSGSEYAHHNMGGINRDVELIALPQDNIARLYSNTDFDEDFVNANLEIVAQLEMYSSDVTLLVEVVDRDDDSVVASGEIDFSQAAMDDDLGEIFRLVGQAETLLSKNKTNLYDGTGGKHGQYSKTSYQALETTTKEAAQFLEGLPTPKGNLSEALKLTIPVNAPKQWDAEHPNLYTLRTTLKVKDEVQQVNTENLGFREIDYGGKDGTDTNKIYVNGKEVKLRSTCRHDVSYDLGRSTTREQDFLEIAAYKEHNINSIRTSHYTGSENLLDACDEIGIYVEQETPICFQGVWGNDVQASDSDFMNQFTEMIEYNRNRPSILIWSLGNESDYSQIPAIQKEYDYVKDMDLTRPVIWSFPYTVPGTVDPKPYDIYSQHYPAYNGDLGSPEIPVYHDEYVHVACYNTGELKQDLNVRNFWGESLKLFWENAFETDGALGGALWGGIDDVFYLPEGTTERWQSHSSGPAAGYGEWGSVLDVYMRLKPEAYLTKKAYSPVRVDEDAMHISGSDLVIPVKNWFDHTNFRELTLKYRTDVDDSWVTVNAPTNLAPHQSGSIWISGDWDGVTVVDLEFITPDGLTVEETSVPLSKEQYSFTDPSSTAPTFTEDTDQITIVGENGFEVKFSKETGLISEAIFNGDTLLTGGPFIHVTGTSLGEWTPDSTDGIVAETQGNQVLVTLKGKYDSGLGVEFVIAVSGNGLIETSYEILAGTTLSNLQEAGIRFDIPETTESVSWEKEGLYNTYPEDHIGRTKGTALRVRENSDTNPDRYGVKPSWPWKDDMRNFFLYAQDDPNEGLATNDFKTMRENIWFYDVNFTGTDSRISVEDENAKVAARVNLKYNLGYIDDRDARIDYVGGWSTYNAAGDYDGTETYSTQLGDSMTFDFYGTGIRYIGSKQNNVGKVKVYIDDEFQEEIDTFSDLGNFLKQTEIFKAEDLTLGNHTIKLVTSGGKANCIVVDAFEILGGDEAGKLENGLIINEQWYYPGLGWGNYMGIAGSLKAGSSGTVTIRLSDTVNHSRGTVPTVSSVILEQSTDTIKANITTVNETLTTTYEYKWYRYKAGNSKNSAEEIAGAITDTYDASAEVIATNIYCTVTPIDGTFRGTTATSETLLYGEVEVKYVDIDVASSVFIFESPTGDGYITDSNKAWTANAYNKTVTYFTKPDVSISYTFTGKGIRLIAAKEKNMGIADIEINDVPVDSLDLYGSATTGTQVYEILFEQTWDTAEERTIKITATGDKNLAATGTNISLDAFLLIGEDSSRIADKEEKELPESTPLTELEPASSVAETEKETSEKEQLESSQETSETESSTSKEEQPESSESSTASEEQSEASESSEQEQTQKEESSSESSTPENETASETTDTDTASTDNQQEDSSGTLDVTPVAVLENTVASERMFEVTYLASNLQGDTTGSLQGNSPYAVAALVTVAEDTSSSERGLDTKASTPGSSTDTRDTSAIKANADFADSQQEARAASSVATPGTASDNTSVTKRVSDTKSLPATLQVDPVESANIKAKLTSALTAFQSSQITIDTGAMEKLIKLAKPVMDAGKKTEHAQKDWDAFVVSYTQATKMLEELTKYTPEQVKQQYQVLETALKALGNGELPEPPTPPGPDPEPNPNPNPNPNPPGTSGGGSSSSKGSSVQDGAKSKASGTVLKQDNSVSMISATKKAVQQAQGKNAKSATVRFQNAQTITVKTLGELKALTKEIELLILADTFVPAGTAVDVRLTLPLQQLSKEVNVKASTTSTRAAKVLKLFQQFFKNKILVLDFEQQEDFEVPLQVAVKLPKDINTEHLTVYSYNMSTNSYRNLNMTNLRVDTNGYLHFSTTTAGILVISDNEFVK